MTDTPPGPARPLPSPEVSDERWITANRQAISGAFISGLAHELNNPLQVVTGTVEMLLARRDLPADVVVRLERIAQQVHRASATIVDVVGFVRDRSASATRVDLRTVVDRVLGLRRYPLARAAITVAYDPPPAGRAMVSAAASDLAQALLNLVMNAEAALAPPAPGAPARSGAPQLRIAIEVSGDRVGLRVADNGPGVAPDVRDRLFEPFASSRPPDVACGLGLTAAAALVAKNGGRLWMEDVPAGASFVIELPLSPGA